MGSAVNTVETVLVILLSVGMVSLLVLSIIFVSILIAVARNVKRISDRADEVTGNVSELVATMSRKVAPMAVSAIAAAVMRRWRGRKAGKED